MDDVLKESASLLRERSGIDAQIAERTGRSARPGDVGEFIASRIFSITLAKAANQPGHDGHFTSGPLADRTVNMNAYGDAAGGIDISPHGCDFYLVLSGSPRLAGVYLLDGPLLVSRLRARGLRIGVATSIRKADLAAAQIYPVEGPQPLLRLTDEQRAKLQLFA